MKSKTKGKTIQKRNRKPNPPPTAGEMASFIAETVRSQMREMLADMRDPMLLELRKFLAGMEALSADLRTAAKDLTRDADDLAKRHRAYDAAIHSLREKVAQPVTAPIIAAATEFSQEMRPLRELVRRLVGIAPRERLPGERVIGDGGWIPR